MSDSNASANRKPWPKFSHDWLVTARQQLDGLGSSPPPHSASVSKQEVVDELAGEIRALRHRGYSLDDITAALNWDKNNFTSIALRSYLKRAQDRASPKSEASPVADKVGTTRISRRSATAIEPKSARKSKASVVTGKAVNTPTDANNKYDDDKA